MSGPRKTSLEIAGKGKGKTVVEASKLRLSKLMNCEDQAKELHEYTHFTLAECAALLKMHARLTAVQSLDRMLMRNILYIALDVSDSFMLDRIFRVADKDGDGIINGEEWLMMLSILLRGTLDELIELCYDLYDINSDRALERKEVAIWLEHSFQPRGDMTAEDIPECLYDLISLTMYKLDGDNNGSITFADYKAAVENDPLLLQSLGACLPPDRAIKGFQYTFAWDYKHFCPVHNNSLNYSVHNKMKKKSNNKQQNWENAAIALSRPYT